jgi:hypothetical protein
VGVYTCPRVPVKKACYDWGVRTFTKLTVPAAILAGGLFFSTTTTLAKPEYTRRTKKDCEFCHPPNNRELNEAGKYYRDHNYSLQGYTPPKDDGKQGKNQAGH